MLRFIKIYSKFKEKLEMGNQIYCTKMKKKMLCTFPEPKKPVIMVAGILLSGGIFVVTSELSLWDVVAAEEATVSLREPLFGLRKSRAMSLERNDIVWE